MASSIRFNNSISNHISIPPVCMLAAGIALYGKFFFAFLALLICGIISTARIIKSIPTRKNFFILLFFTFLGLGILRPYCQSPFNKDIVHMIDSATCDVAGVILDIQESYAKHLPWKTTISVYAIRKNNIHDQNKWLPISFNLAIYSAYKPTIEVDDIVQLYHLSFNNLHKKEARAYLNEYHAATLFLPSFSPILIKRPTLSINRLINKKSIQMLAALKQNMSPLLFSLFSSIFLGNRTYIEHNLLLKNTFKQWGLIHFLARSGLHLLIIGLVLHFLCTYIGLPFFVKNIFVYCILILYSILTWSSAPFIRALITFGLTSLAKIFSVEVDSLHSLNIAFIFMLLANPAYLINLNFQLSFAITYALIIITKFPIRSPVIANY